MKIYKITEASEYFGVSINTLKPLANNLEDMCKLVFKGKGEKRATLNEHQ